MLGNIGFYFYLFEKFSFVLGAVIYLIFATIIVKQVATMTKNVNDKFNAVLVLFSYGHLVFAILLVLLILILL